MKFQIKDLTCYAVSASLLTLHHLHRLSSPRTITSATDAHPVINEEKENLECIRQLCEQPNDDRKSPFVTWCLQNQDLIQNIIESVNSSPSTLSIKMQTNEKKRIWTV